MNDCTCLESSEDGVNVSLQLSDGCGKRRIFEEKEEHRAVKLSPLLRFSYQIELWLRLSLVVETDSWPIDEINH